MSTTLTGSLAAATAKMRANITAAQDRVLVDMAKYLRSYAIQNKPPQPPDTVYARTDNTFVRPLSISPVEAEGSRRSIYVGASVRTATGGFLSKFIEEGTGLYGPSGKRIYPIRAKALRWQGKANRMAGVPGGKIGPSRFNVGVRKIASGVGIGKAGKPGFAPNFNNLGRYQAAAGRKVLKRLASRDMYAMYARSIRGMKGWGLLKKSSESTEVKAYIEARTAQMWKDVTDIASRS